MVIRIIGSTSLEWKQYLLDPVAGGTGPELKMSGAAVRLTQTGGWTPIGVEQTATGYEIAWKVTGTIEYSVWNTDSNGNYISNVIGAVSGRALPRNRSRPPSIRISMAMERSDS